MKIGVVAVQGSVAEHIEAFSRVDCCGIVVEQVRKPSHLCGVEGLVLPGGESTAISRLLKSTGLFEALQEAGGQGIPIMGTCAGCVLLSSSLDDPSMEAKTPLLGLMAMSAGRNAFGRQRESFETPVDLEGIGTFPGVFIRAPSISKVWDDCRVMGRVDGNIVAVEQGSFMALSFHPELSEDPRLHRYFVEKVIAASESRRQHSC